AGALRPLRKPGDLPAPVARRRTGVPQPARGTIWPLAGPLSAMEKDRPNVTVTLHVCTTCRMGQPTADDTVRPGARLLQALQAEGAPEGVRIVPVECLSACDHGCNIAISGPGRWSYVYRGLDPDEHVTDILAGVAAYAAS